MVIYSCKDNIFFFAIPNFILKFVSQKDFFYKNSIK
jgi:hypothetical protein